MARTEARIKATMWEDADFKALTPNAQWLYTMLLSQRGLSFAGVLPYTPKRWATLAKGVTPAVITRTIAELQTNRYIVVDTGTEELWIRTFVRHDGILDNPRLKRVHADDVNAIQSPIIRAEYHAEYGGTDPPPDGDTDGDRNRGTDPDSDPNNNGDTNGVAMPIGMGPTRTRGRSAGTPPPNTPSPAFRRPPSERPPTTPTGNGSRNPETDEKSGNPKNPPDPLVERWLTITGKPHTRPQTELIVRHLRAHVDPTVIDERIGYCATLDQPPHSPNYLLRTCADWAAQHNIAIPALPKGA